MKTPRSYQADAHNALIQFLMNAALRDYVGAPLVVAPTGSGKSLMIAMILKWVFENFPNERWILVTHDQRLIEQNVEELVEEWPLAPVGIYCAGLKKKESHARIVFASIQSVARNTAVLGKCTGMLIDEAHMVPVKQSANYRKVINKFRDMAPNMPVVGLTATPYRLGSGHLHTGPDRLFTDIVFDIPVSLLIEEGHLCPVITKGGLHKIDLSAIKKRGGEYIESDIQKAVKSDVAFTEDAVEEIIKYGADRRSWVIFCSGVDHAEDTAAALKARNIICPAVHSKNTKAQNDKILADLKAGRIQGVCNMGMLTTGFNHPPLDLVVFLRPTNSASLYVQMVGRGMRTCKGKTECLVLDFAGNVLRHGPIDLLKIEDPTGGKPGTAPAKECPQCAWIGPTGTRFCPECNHEFEFESAVVDVVASEEAILSNQLAPVRAVPTRVQYRNTDKSQADPSKKDTMKVTYFCGFKVYNEWVCVEHPESGRAGRKATRWFEQRQLPRVNSVGQAVALAQQLPVPLEITVEKDGDFDLISRITLPEPDNAEHTYRVEQASAPPSPLWEDDIPF